MPALKKVTPVILKEIMEAADWAVYTEDRWNWSLVNADGVSVEIPKRGRLVSFQVMENALAQAELLPGDYFRLLAIVEEARRLRGLPPDGTEAHPRIH
ncbi:MAG TPA: hypothetical protein VMU80_20670 [Bryobacteraceae bacterium]|nr:hypothetical protein [Bryobacteraceae bacterium]HUO31647.1 hypothetical protein [Bryobacteraceae bacterium]